MIGVMRQDGLCGLLPLPVVCRFRAKKEPGHVLQEPSVCGHASGVLQD
jgi:hypothetical protein